MSSPLEDLIRKHLPPTRNTKNGWEKFDAPCCTHNGEGRDKRSRGNIIFSPDGISYNCFNCQYKASWKYGTKRISKKMLDLVSWLGADRDEISSVKLKTFSLFQDNEQKTDSDFVYRSFDFNEMALPPESKLMNEILSEQTNYDSDFMDVISYLSNRGERILDYPNYYWSSDKKFRRQVIIPFYWDNVIVGYSTRAIDKDVKIRYFNYKQPNYLYNTEVIKPHHKIIIVVEGILDAIAINGVATLGASMTKQQAQWLKNQNKEVLVFGDHDASGMRFKKSAENYGFKTVGKLNVECKDALDLTNKVGVVKAVSEILKSGV